MVVRVLCLGGLRSTVTGVKEHHVEIADGATVAQLLDELTRQHPGLGGLGSSLRVAVNLEVVHPTQVLGPGDEVALLPPVAGGADGADGHPEGTTTVDRRCRLVQTPIDMNAVVGAVVGPGHGALITFVGLVRDNNDGHAVLGLDYEAYEPMVMRSLTDIMQHCEAASPGAKVAVTHRVGHLDVGDIAVAIAAGAPHRAEAFAGCRSCIELLKQETPIWKHETSPDGDLWIGLGP